MFIKYVDKIDALTNIPQGQPAVTLRAGVLGIFRTEFGFHVFLRAARGGLDFPSLKKKTGNIDTVDGQRNPNH